jgi:PAS domain-containing protein
MGGLNRTFRSDVPKTPIVDFERHSFVSWNPRFLEHTGFSEDEMKSSKAEELLMFGESWFPLSDDGFAVRSYGNRFRYLRLCICPI